MEPMLSAALARHEAKKRVEERAYEELLEANANRLKLLDSLIVLLRQHPTNTVGLLKTRFSRCLWYLLLTLSAAVAWYGISTISGQAVLPYFFAFLGCYSICILIVEGKFNSPSTVLTKKTVRLDKDDSRTYWLKFNKRGRWFVDNQSVLSRQGLENLKRFTDEEIIDAFIAFCERNGIELRGRLSR